MAVINDASDKNREYKPAEPVYVHSYAETLTCRVCGKQYFSRGKHDPGICRECEKEEKAYLVGGPFDGEKAHQ